MLSLFLPVLDTTIVNVALPYMIGSLDTNQDEVRWVITAYSMAFAVSTLASAWLRTVFGIKNLYLGSIVLFVASSFFAGISPNLNLMIVFRVLQAVGGGIMMPLGFTIITENRPGCGYGFPLKAPDAGRHPWHRQWRSSPEPAGSP